MPPTVCQLLFRRINDAVQVTGYDPDERFVPRLCVAHTEEFKECPNVELVAMGVLAAKAANRIELVGFKIGRTGVELVGVLMHPRTGYVVLPGAQRRFVQPPCFEGRNDRVLRRLRRQNIVGVIANAARCPVRRRRWFRGFLGPTSRRESCGV